MSGEGLISATRWPATRSAASPYDICECGDYRQDHEGGRGAVTFPPDPVPGHQPCARFRISVKSQAGGRHGG